MHLNKLISALLIIVLSTIGCNNKSNEERYNIAGVIKNASNQKILLQEIEKLTKKPLIQIPAPDVSGDLSADPIFYLPYQGGTPNANPSSSSIVSPKSTSTVRTVGALLGSKKKN